MDANDNETTHDQLCRVQTKFIRNNKIICHFIRAHTVNLSSARELSVRKWFDFSCCCWHFRYCSHPRRKKKHADFAIEINRRMYANTRTVEWIWRCDFSLFVPLGVQRYGLEAWTAATWMVKLSVVDYMLNYTKISFMLILLYNIRSHAITLTRMANDGRMERKIKIKKKRNNEIKTLIVAGMCASTTVRWLAIASRHWLPMEFGAAKTNKFDENSN